LEYSPFQFDQKHLTLKIEIQVISIFIKGLIEINKSVLRDEIVVITFSCKSGHKKTFCNVGKRVLLHFSLRTLNLLKGSSLIKSKSG
jgi:predicted transglutaminase-like protease